MKVDKQVIDFVVANGNKIYKQLKEEVEFNRYERSDIIQFLIKDIFISMHLHNIGVFVFTENDWREWTDSSQAFVRKFAEEIVE